MKWGESTDRPGEHRKRFGAGFRRRHILKTGPEGSCQRE